MGFPESVVSVFAGTFKFSGRAPRSEFWWFFLFEILAIFALTIVDFITISRVINLGMTEAQLLAAVNPFTMTLFYYTILSFFPRMSVTIRRLHDVGLSGWFYLLYLVPAVGGLVVFIIMMFPSESGGNKFGPPHNRLRRTGAADQADMMQGYGTPRRADGVTAADMQAARKAEVRALYEQRVLGRTLEKAPTPAE